MTKDQLNKSVSLIGPASIGKSLLSSELSKKLGIPAINFDDLILMIEYEKKGLLSLNKQDQDNFLDYCLDDLYNDDKLYKNVTQEYLGKEVELIKDFIKTYAKYREILGDLTPLYNLTNYTTFLEDSSYNPIELNILLNNLSLRIMQYIISNANCPVIFDFPAPFGWQIDNDFVNYALQKKFKNTPLEGNSKKLNKEMHKLIDKTHSILLTPGRDYHLRNAAKNSDCNNLILKHLDNYYPNADIEITTNGLFNDPQNKAFNTRMYFDAVYSTVREQLRNNSVINNMADEIIERIEELTMTGN